MLWIFALGLFFFIMVVGMFIIFSKASYKHKALIAVQSGTSANDIVWIEDFFRVRKLEDGYYVAQFKNLRSDMTPSPRFSYWQKFVKGKSSYKGVDDKDVEGLSKKELKQQNKWTKEQMKRYLMRGAIFYKTSEGELKPMVIKQEGELTVLDQDNRAFLMGEAQRRAKLNQSKTDKWIKAGLILGAMFFSAAIFIFALVYVNISLADTVGAICNGAMSQAPNAIQGIAKEVIAG